MTKVSESRTFHSYMLLPGLRMDEAGFNDFISMFTFGTGILETLIVFNSSMFIKRLSAMPA